MILKIFLIFFLFCNICFAKIIEEVIEVPASVTNGNRDKNLKLEQKIIVTIWREDSIKKAPYLLFSHGRPGTGKERVSFGRYSEKINSEYFVNPSHTFKLISLGLPIVIFIKLSEFNISFVIAFKLSS